MSVCRGVQRFRYVTPGPRASGLTTSSISRSSCHSLVPGTRDAIFITPTRSNPAFS